MAGKGRRFHRDRFVVAVAVAGLDVPRAQGLALAQKPRRSEMQKWEFYYFIGNTDDENKSKSTEEQLKQLGLQGWELVSVAPSKGQGWGNFLFAFKRPAE